MRDVGGMNCIANLPSAAFVHIHVLQASQKNRSQKEQALGGFIGIYYGT